MIFKINRHQEKLSKKTNSWFAFKNEPLGKKENGISIISRYKYKSNFSISNYDNLIHFKNFYKTNLQNLSWEFALERYTVKGLFSLNTMLIWNERQAIKAYYVLFRNLFF